MDERTQFIAACLLHEASMSEACRRLGVSRKTGYKRLSRYVAGGPPALIARSHAPHRQPAAVSIANERAIVALRARHPHWGPRELRAWLEQHATGKWPAPSTIGALLQRAGLTAQRVTHQPGLMCYQSARPYTGAVESEAARSPSPALARRQRLAMTARPGPARPAPGVTGFRGTP